MNAAELLAEVECHGGRLSLSGGRLRVTAPTPLPGELVEQMRAQKAELLRLADYERRVRAWLAHIGETDPATIADVLARCQSDAQARAYCLGQARQVPPPPEPDHTATCGACRHFQRIDHPSLGHCAQGEPEAIAGLCDTDRRWCRSFE